MTKEDKQLLLKYLCAALPFNVIVECSIDSGESVDLFLNTSHIDELINGSLIVKPYLRSMSSITEEEQFDYYKSSIELGCIPELPIEPTTLAIDWLLKNHFDFRGLIERGLAIEVTEENNPYKE